MAVLSPALPVGSICSESNPLPISTPSPFGFATSNFFTVILEKTFKFQPKILDLFNNHHNANAIETKAQHHITDLKLQSKDVSSL